MDAARFEQDHWDELYSSKEALWGGQPNLQLVAHAADLPAGQALEVGCGEGGDSLWLAERGWHVLGIDLSEVALERTARLVAERGLNDRVTLQHADIRTWAAPAGRFDLVNAQFFHLPADMREAVWPNVANAVALGGTLLVVAHDPSDPHILEHGDHGPDLFYTGDEVVAHLAGWDVVVNEVVDRLHRDGSPGRDLVVRAVRLPHSG